MTNTENAIYSLAIAARAGVLNTLLQSLPMVDPGYYFYLGAHISADLTQRIHDDPNHFLNLYAGNRRGNAKEVIYG